MTLDTGATEPPRPDRRARIASVRSAMAREGVDTLLLSVGPDLPWLTGYEAMPLERLTMLVVPAAGDLSLVVPRLEAPRVDTNEGCFDVVAWDETDDPVAIVAAMVPDSASVAVGDRTWARFVIELQRARPRVTWRRGNDVVGPIRARKDDAELAALARAAAAVDEIAIAMRAVQFGGRTEYEIHRELADRILAIGHERLNFAIVAAGANAASPHHSAGPRRIETGDLVLCDFGGTMGGYCSDITRMFSVGPPLAEVADAYAALQEAQEAGVRAAVVGTACEAVDRAARAVIAAAGHGEHFVHRTGHGIGAEEHEDPYIVDGNRQRLEPGNAFSIEPGIYVAGRFGMRLEDIVIATDDGPRRLNHAPRDIAVVA
jgi:Xaa-Pro aminopeptidase